MADACDSIHATLSYALSDRVQLISFRWARTCPWALNMHPTDEIKITVNTCFLVNPDSVSRLLDHGPLIEDKKAAVAFRDFWGEKAELRRFKDGTISETAVWPPEITKGTILFQIASFALARHHSKDLANSLQPFVDDLWQILPANAASHTLASFVPTMESFELLSKHISDIEDVPLEVRQISSASSALRYSTIHVPSIDSASNESISIVLQFESSARWPDDLAAIQKVKIALLIKLGDLLELKSSAYKTQLGLENESLPMLNPAFLDIFTSSICFRLRIYHDREGIILERHLISNSISSAVKEYTAIAIASYSKTYIHAPKHTQVLKSLSTQFSLLSPTIRLLKIWCSRHLLLPHLDEELIELLAVKTFTDPQPYDTPGTLRTAFVRTLSMIARWKWPTEPLLIPLNDGFSVEEANDFQTRFEAWRRIDPIMNRVVLFVGTPLDPSGLVWTQQRPKKVIAARLCALAKATLALASSQGYKVDAKPLVTTRVKDYDFLIYTNNRIEKKIVQQGTVVVASLNAFVKQLEETYGDNILFSHDVQKATIGGLWNPAAGPRSWKVNLSYSTMPLGTDYRVENDATHISINKEAILHELARMGGDLISKIEILRN